MTKERTCSGKFLDLKQQQVPDAFLLLLVLNSHLSVLLLLSPLPMTSLFAAPLMPTPVLIPHPFLVQDPGLQASQGSPIGLGQAVGEKGQDVVSPENHQAFCPRPF